MINFDEDGWHYGLFFYPTPGLVDATVVAALSSPTQEDRAGASVAEATPSLYGLPGRR